MRRRRDIEKPFNARSIRVSDETYDAILKLNPDLGFSTLVRKILEEYVRKLKK